MKKLIPILLFICFFTTKHCAAQQSPDVLAPVPAANAIDPWSVSAVTVSGGPVWSKHFQSGNPDFNDHHEIGIIKVSTNDRGNWGLYYLGPNSVRRQSVGAGYITNPYVIPLGATQLELSGALGLVTGYQSYPVPLLAADVRMPFYTQGQWNAGLEMAAMPYIAEDRTTGKNQFGVVGVTPFLSVQYKFQ